MVLCAQAATGLSPEPDKSTSYCSSKIHFNYNFCNITEKTVSQFLLLLWPFHPTSSLSFTPSPSPFSSNHQVFSIILSMASPNSLRFVSKVPSLPRRHTEEQNYTNIKYTSSKSWREHRCLLEHGMLWKFQSRLVYFFPNSLLQFIANT
jgi:hypothetical protein